jgi:hypothetical protein
LVALYARMVQHRHHHIDPSSPTPPDGPQQIWLSVHHLVAKVTLL